MAPEKASESSLGTVCELCELMKDKGEFAVVYCKTCSVPMLVFHNHTTLVDNELMQKGLKTLTEEANSFFGEGKWHYRFQQRRILNHCHVHAEAGIREERR